MQHFILQENAKPSTILKIAEKITILDTKFPLTLSVIIVPKS